MADDDYSAIVIQFWRHIAAGKWDEARDLLAEEIEVVWHQTREMIKGRDKYLEILRQYLGKFDIQFNHSYHEYDKWDWEDHVTLEVIIDQSMPDEQKKRIFCMGIYDLRADEDSGEYVITGASQYWIESSEPPEWRRGLAERF